MKHHRSARSSHFFSVLSLTPYHFSAAPKKIASLLWAQLIPPLKEKRRKESSWLATSISFSFHVHSILKHPVLEGARAGVRSRVRPGDKSVGGTCSRKEKDIGVVRKAGGRETERKTYVRRQTRACCSAQLWARPGWLDGAFIRNVSEAL